MHARVSPEALDMIAHFEGFKSKAYLCSANKWTVGYGHTGPIDYDNTYYASVKQLVHARGLFQITKERALELMVDEVSKRVDLVSGLLGDFNKNLLTHQIGALVSLHYNIGHSNFQRSTVLKRILNGALSGSLPEHWEPSSAHVAFSNDQTIMEAWMRWHKVSFPDGEKRVMAGLLRRRAAEFTLYSETYSIKTKMARFGL